MDFCSSNLYEIYMQVWLKPEVINEKPHSNNNIHPPGTDRRSSASGFLFIFILISYMLSVTGNLTIITLTLVDAYLKIRIYFFLQNFSFLEISFTTACVPRFLNSLSTGDRKITCNECAIPLFLTDLFGVTEFFLLATMSYDRYVAICKPLHYMKIMRNKVCNTMIICCWMAAFVIILPPLSLVLRLEFCDSNIIDHFGCDASPMLKISCLVTWLIEQMVIACAVLMFIITVVCVVLSYIYIIRTVIKFPTVQQRKKAYSTCCSHMIVVSITYNSCIFIYIKPSAKDTVDIDKGVSVIISSRSPM